jgi:hypothetical protein
MIVEAEINPGQLAYEMSTELSDTELVQFVMDLDEHVQDIDFTKSVAEHLNNLIRIYEEN